MLLSPMRLAAPAAVLFAVCTASAFACDKCGHRGPSCYGYGVGGTVDVEFAGCACGCGTPCGCDAAPACAAPACAAPACAAPACAAPAYVAPTCDYGYAGGGCDNGCNCGRKDGLFSKMMRCEKNKNSWLKKMFCGLKDDCDCVPVYYYDACGCEPACDAPYGPGYGAAAYGPGPGYGAGYGVGAGCGCH